MELLRWTGRTASIPRVEREKGPKQVPTETHEAGCRIAQQSMATNLLIL